MRNARILQSGSGSLLSALCNWFWIFALAANVVDFAVYENVVRAETDFAIGLAAPASLRADGCAAPGGWHFGSTRAAGRLCMRCGVTVQVRVWLAQCRVVVVRCAVPGRAESVYHKTGVCV